MSGTPLRPFKHASANTAPAYLHPKINISKTNWSGASPEISIKLIWLLCITKLDGN